MTIETRDIERYEDTTDSFKYQPDLCDCLPVAVKNVLHELAERHEKDQIKCSESDIKKMSDYDPDWGTSGRQLVPNLSTELEQYGYTVKDQMNTTISELDDIIRKDTTSYPAVAVGPSYFDTISNWDPRGSRRGKNTDHTVVPFKINSNEILFFDPYGGIQLRSGSVSEPKRRIDQGDFFNLWNKDATLPRWTLWIERLQETTLQYFSASD